MQCIYGILSREITVVTVIYCVHIRFWPTPFNFNYVHLQFKLWTCVQRTHFDCARNYVGNLRACVA